MPVQEQTKAALAHSTPQKEVSVTFAFETIKNAFHRGTFWLVSGAPDCKDHESAKARIFETSPKDITADQLSRYESSLKVDGEKYIEMISTCERSAQQNFSKQKFFSQDQKRQANKSLLEQCLELKKHIYTCTQTELTNLRTFQVETWRPAQIDRILSEARLKLVQLPKSLLELFEKADTMKALLISNLSQANVDIHSEPHKGVEKLRRDLNNFVKECQDLLPLIQAAETAHLEDLKKIGPSLKTDLARYDVESTKNLDLLVNIGELETVIVQRIASFRIDLEAHVKNIDAKPFQRSEKFLKSIENYNAEAKLELSSELVDCKTRMNQRIEAYQSRVSDLFETFQNNASQKSLESTKLTHEKLLTELEDESLSYQEEVMKIFTSNRQLELDSMRNFVSKCKDRLEQVDVSGFGKDSFSEQLKDILLKCRADLHEIIQKQFAKFTYEYEKAITFEFCRCKIDVFYPVELVRSFRLGKSDSDSRLESDLAVIELGRNQLIEAFAKEMLNIRLDFDKKFKLNMCDIQKHVRQVETIKADLLHMKSKDTLTVILTTKAQTQEQMRLLKEHHAECVAAFEERYEKIKLIQNNATSQKRNDQYQPDSASTEEWSDLKLWEMANKVYKDIADGLNSAEEARVANIRLKDWLGVYQNRFELNYNVLNQVHEKFSDFGAKITQECAYINSVDSLLISCTRKLAETARSRKMAIRCLLDKLEEPVHKAQEVFELEKCFLLSARDVKAETACIDKHIEDLQKATTNFYETLTHTLIRTDDLTLDAELNSKRINARVNELRKNNNCEHEEIDREYALAKLRFAPVHERLSLKVLESHYNEWREIARSYHDSAVAHLEKISEKRQESRVRIYNRLKADLQVLEQLSRENDDQKLAFQEALDKYSLDTIQMYESLSQEQKSKLTSLKKRFKDAEELGDHEKINALAAEIGVLIDQDVHNLRTIFANRSRDLTAEESEWQMTFKQLSESAAAFAKQEKQ